MDWIEVTARTVDDAKELALDRLGVVEDELEYEVVDEARKGLFGIARGRRPDPGPGEADLAGEAVRPQAPAAPERAHRRVGGQWRRPGAAAGSGGRGPAAASAGADAAARADAADERRSQSAATSRRRPAELPVRAAAAGAGVVGAGSGADAGAGCRGRAATERCRRNGKAEVDVETVPVADQAEHAAKFTDELVRTMGFSATVRTEIDDDDVTVHIEGDGLGALVGPAGVTIQALEEVVRAVVQHHAGGHSAWVHVDVAGYRERRRQALAEFARTGRGRGRETGEERALEPMGAADRKVVHDVVAEIDGVDTTSEGEEPRRRVVIFPATAVASRGRNRRCVHRASSRALGTGAGRFLGPGPVEPHISRTPRASRSRPRTRSADPRAIRRPRDRRRRARAGAGRCAGPRRRGSSSRAITGAAPALRRRVGAPRA